MVNRAQRRQISWIGQILHENSLFTMKVLAGITEGMKQTGRSKNCTVGSCDG